MNKKQMMKRMIGLSLLAGLFLPIVANADSYTVKSGDTLSAIAKEKNTTVDAIAKKNKISNVNLISVANQYVVNRYGSWSAAKNFWLANGWY